MQEMLTYPGQPFSSLRLNIYVAFFIATIGNPLYS
jgi:hypothetical protein